MRFRITGKIAAMDAGPGAALLIFLCHVAIAVYFYFVGIQYKITPYYWAAALALASSIPYVIAIMKGSFFPYEGNYIFLAGNLVGFTAWLFMPPHEINLNPEGWNYAMKVAFGGTLLFLAGYAAVFGKMIGNALPLRRFVFLDAALSKVSTKLYFVGWILRTIPKLSELGMSVFERVGIFGIPMKILNKMQGWEIINMLTSYGICAGLMIDTYLYFSGRRKRIVLIRLLFFLFLEIANGFLSGMAQNTIRPFIFVGLAYMKAKKRIPFIPIILISVFFVFYVVPFVKTFREQYWYGSDISQSISYAKESLSDESRFSSKRNETFIRLSNPLEMAVVCYENRKEGRRLSTYSGVPEYLSRFVPRFIWPDKPSVDYNKIGREINLLHQDDYSTSISLTFIGGLIMDFGTPGVMVGMFLIGILLRTLWQWLIIRSEGNMFAFAIYSALIYRFIFPDDFYGILHAVISFVIYAYILASLVNRSYYERVSKA